MTNISKKTQDIPVLSKVGSAVGFGGAAHDKKEYMKANYGSLRGYDNVRKQYDEEVKTHKKAGNMKKFREEYPDFDAYWRKKV